MARVHGKRSDIDGIVRVSMQKNNTHLMGVIFTMGLFGFYCWGVFAGFARFGLDDEIDDDGGDSEDDEEEKPDRALDDHFLDLRGNAFEFYGIDYIEDADGGSIVPSGFVVI